MGDYFKKTAFSFKYGYYAAEWLLGIFLIIPTS